MSGVRSATESSKPGVGGGDQLHPGWSGKPWLMRCYWGRALNQVREKGLRICSGREFLGNKSTKARSQNVSVGRAHVPMAVNTCHLASPKPFPPLDCPLLSACFSFEQPRSTSARSSQNDFFSACLLRAQFSAHF